MARLIDIEAINWYDDLFMKGENHSGVWVRYRDVEKIIRNAPTVDAVPVVRCMDCKWWSEKLWACTDRGHGLASSDPDFYCADGERKGVDE